MDEKDLVRRLATLRTKKNVSAREMSLSIGQNQGYIRNIIDKPKIRVIY